MGLKPKKIAELFLALHEKLDDLHEQMNRLEAKVPDSKRDRFARAALQGLLANNASARNEEVCERAWFIADLMLRTGCEPD